MKLGIFSDNILGAPLTAMFCICFEEDRKNDKEIFR